MGFIDLHAYVSSRSPIRRRYLIFASFSDFKAPVSIYPDPPNASAAQTIFVHTRNEKVTKWLVEQNRDTIGEQEFLRRQHAARQLFNYATSYFADVASIFRFFFSLSPSLSPSFPSSHGQHICRPDSTAVCYFIQRPISIITRFSFAKLFFVII